MSVAYGEYPQEDRKSAVSRKDYWQRRNKIKHRFKSELALDIGTITTANQGRIRADSMRSNPRVVEQSYGHVQHITRLTQTGLEGREVLLDGAHNRPKFEIARSREI
jgi:hypothetical protein